MEDVVRVYQCIIKLPEMIVALEGGGVDNEEWKELIKEVWLDHLKVRSFAVVGVSDADKVRMRMYRNSLRR